MVQSNPNDDLEQIDHVIRLFQNARKSQNTKNIRLTLGLREGESYFIYSVFPSKASKRRNQKKQRKVPVPEQTVEPADSPEEIVPPPPPSEPSTTPAMLTRQRKRRRQDSNKTPEQVRAPQSVRANTPVLSPSPTVPQYAVPTKNRYQHLPDILDEDSKESDGNDTDGEHSDGADSHDSVSSFSACKCEEKCNNREHSPILNKCEFSCVCECMRENLETCQSANFKHTCKRCSCYKMKFKASLS